MDRPSLRKFAFFASIIILALLLPARGEERLDPEIGQAKAVIAEHGMVVAQEALAARIGAEFLQRAATPSMPRLRSASPWR